MRQEGLFHPLIEAGALTHIWLGEARPSPASLANFVVKVFRQTQNDQIAFSPEFTTCNLCHRTSRGLRPSCPYCGAEDVDGITRITGYFTKISSWNKGKIGELRNRYRNQAFFDGKEEGFSRAARFHRNNRLPRSSAKRMQRQYQSSKARSIKKASQSGTQCTRKGSFVTRVGIFRMLTFDRL